MPSLLDTLPGKQLAPILNEQLALWRGHTI
jgi:hypothetical protein